MAMRLYPENIRRFVVDAFEGSPGIESQKREILAQPVFWPSQDAGRALLAHGYRDRKGVDGFSAADFISAGRRD